MTVLMSIGPVDFDSSIWAVAGWPRPKYGRTLAEYELASGDYAVRFRGRRAPSMTVVMRHAPGQPFEADAIFPDRPQGGVGEGWHSVLQPVIALAALEDAGPVAVSIGDLDLGEWWVESVEPSSDDSVVAGGSHGGFAPTVVEVTIVLRGHRDALVDHTPANGPPRSVF